MRNTQASLLLSFRHADPSSSSAGSSSTTSFLSSFKLPILFAALLCVLFPPTSNALIVPSHKRPSSSSTISNSLGRGTKSAGATTTTTTTTTTSSSPSTNTFIRTTQPLYVVWDPFVTDSGGLVDFPTSKQRVELKKEAQRRLARKELVSYTLPTASSEEEKEKPTSTDVVVTTTIEDHEAGTTISIVDGDGSPSSSSTSSTSSSPSMLFSEQTITDITRLLLLEGNELILVKGISKDNKKDVFTTATQLCEQIEERIMFMTTMDGMTDENDDDDDDDVINDENDKDGYNDDDNDTTSLLPVTLLSMKGHTALIYCPTLPMDHPNKFILRTSVGQKNVWTARIKPPRDHRGQIIKEQKIDK